LIVTPWRGLILPDLPNVDPDLMKTLTDSGLSLDSRSGWSQVSACTGAPGCTNAHARTQPVAAQLAELAGAGAGLPVHVVACERRCGSTTSEHVEVLLGPSEWLVQIRSTAVVRSTTQQSGTLTEMSTLANAVACARNDW
jgi:precorrin-3B synthase